MCRLSLIPSYGPCGADALVAWAVQATEKKNSISLCHLRDNPAETLPALYEREHLNPKLKP